MIKRDHLRDIIAKAAADVGCPQHEVEKLVASADNIDKVAVGRFAARAGAEVCGCPATNAGYYIRNNPNVVDAGHWAKGTSDEIKKFPLEFDGRFMFETAPQDFDGLDYVRVED